MTSPIDIMMNQVNWEPLEIFTPDENSDLPHVTHKGKVKIGEIYLKCYQLSDGNRIIDAEDMDRWFGGMS